MTEARADPGARTRAGPGLKSRREVDGILLLDKPLGLSSNQALQVVKRLFGARKAGHTGSLDPLASGMLPVCLGEATKVSGFLLDCDKTYWVRICFGSKTTTGDAEGDVIASGPCQVDEASLQSVITATRGTMMQVPPMYSALKHHGRPLYELARAGVAVARPARRITVHEVVLETYDPQHPLIRVRCGKGTYIRTLVEQMAEQLGTVAHVAGLRRLAVGPFSATEMVTVAELEAAAASGGQPALDRSLLPADRAIASWPAVTLGSEMVWRLRCGQRLEAEPGQSDQATGFVRLYAEGQQFVGIGERLPGGSVVPRRLMAARNPAPPDEFGL